VAYCKKGLEHLLGNRDPATGWLDLVRFMGGKQGSHTYTNAAAAGALREGARIASTLGYEYSQSHGQMEQESSRKRFSNTCGRQSDRFLKSVSPTILYRHSKSLALRIRSEFSNLDDQRILSSSRQIENAFAYASEE